MTAIQMSRHAPRDSADEHGELVVRQVVLNMTIGETG